MEITKTDNWQRLQHALLLEGASLAVTPIAKTGVKLALMTLDDVNVQLNSAQIQAWWQKLPYWAFAWVGGQALAGHIHRNARDLGNKTVLDFGCGSGLAGIAAAKAGAHVYVLDSDPMALLAAQVNAELNGVRVMPINDASLLTKDIDLLLAADVLYDISSNKDLSAWLKQVPEWWLAESQSIVEQRRCLPELQAIEQSVFGTLPVLDDFDQQVEICIYRRQINIE